VPQQDGETSIAADLPRGMHGVLRWSDDHHAVDERVVRPASELVLHGAGGSLRGRRGAAVAVIEQFDATPSAPPPVSVVTRAGDQSTAAACGLRAYPAQEAGEKVALDGRKLRLWLQQQSRILAVPLREGLYDLLIVSVVDGTVGSIALKV